MYVYNGVNNIIMFLHGPRSQNCKMLKLIGKFI